MHFLEKIKKKSFWINFAKITIPFFVIVTVVSLLINSSSEIFSGDFKALSQSNFTNGKWKVFFAYKIVLSIFYGLYITNKNTK
ncbi:hypothetical protein DUT90_12680 [Polaribacter sp. WD7]|uniref:hypothetical protein n=1 Tax=Polaribacter sp. WD7 TaxID=2269061 RepID=UPI000DF1FF96|nr:hypothetical protein [Polaribacter sp. WD7]RCS26599.1 hypothetical protein DUT90_12680 [Polaribacter sp. WD7]